MKLQSEAAFMQVYLAQPLRRTGLQELATEYHQETEAYAQKVCTGKTDEGVAVPMTADQRRLININALEVHRVKLIQVRELGFTNKDFWQAVVNAARYEPNIRNTKSASSS